MEDYQECFLHQLAHCKNVFEEQIDIFTAGLRNPLQTDIELQGLETLDNAMALARAFKHRLKVDDEENTGMTRIPPHPCQPRFTNTPHTPPGSTSKDPLPTPPAPTKDAPPSGTYFKRVTPQEMAQCQADSLCFNCPEKFF